MRKSTRTALFIGSMILVVVIVLPTVFGSVAGWQDRGWGMMDSWMMGGFGWMWFMPVLGIAVIAIVVWAVVTSARRSDGSGGSDSPRLDSALDVLKKRYARGEIDKQEFEEKKKDLS